VWSNKENDRRASSWADYESIYALQLYWPWFIKVFCEFQSRAVNKSEKFFNDFNKIEFVHTYVYPSDLKMLKPVASSPMGI